MFALFGAAVVGVSESLKSGGEHAFAPSFAEKYSTLFLAVYSRVGSGPKPTGIVYGISINMPYAYSERCAALQTCMDRNEGYQGSRGPQLHVIFGLGDYCGRIVSACAYVRKKGCAQLVLQTEALHKSLRPPTGMRRRSEALDRSQNQVTDPTSSRFSLKLP